jgi:hypothetical protein
MNCLFCLSKDDRPSASAIFLTPGVFVRPHMVKRDLDGKPTTSCHDHEEDPSWGLHSLRSQAKLKI